MKTWLSVDLQGRTQPVVLPLRRIPACGPGGGAGSKQIRAARRVVGGGRPQARVGTPEPVKFVPSNFMLHTTSRVGL